VPDRREVWYTDGESGLYDLRIDKSVWPQASAPRGSACTARTRSRHVRVRSGRATLVRVKVTKGGRRVRGAAVRLRGPGFSRRARTNSHGQVVFKVRAQRNGRATVSTLLCGARLRASAKAIARPDDRP
ncbi:MAG: hypothetical protein QOF37_766, partial [Thermoleophilaceae bacterium]|nr:hypothetical protein [Thermoleophilaceae bacterium]